MSREVCYTCHRAKVACLCARIEKHANPVNIIVLQHPDEVKNSKGSAIIAELGLKQYQAWVGEDFRQVKALNELIENASEEMLVLFPAKQAVDLKRNMSEKAKYLIIIDASWRKARKIWETNKQLHKLKCVKLVTDRSSNYRIRKVPQQGYLSTIESIVEGLRVLDKSPGAYQPLLDLFYEMIDFQISKMGHEVYVKNYKKE